MMESIFAIGIILMIDKGEKMKKTIGVGIVSIILCILLSLSVIAFIPQDKIKDHMKDSADYLKERELFAFLADGRFNTLQDNYADTMLFNILYHQDYKDPWGTLLEAPYYDSHTSQANEEFWKAVQDPQETNQEYARYWHGSMIFVRPLLLFFSIQGIRLILGGCAFLCLLVSCWLLVRKKAAPLAVCLLLGYFAVHGWMTLVCIEYVMPFLVMSVMLLAILLLDGKGQTLFEKDIRWIFAAGGIVTCFVDFLTTETLVLTIPLFVIFGLYRQRYGLADKKAPAKKFLQYALSFGISYAFMFAVKWILASLYMGEGTLQSIMKVAFERILGDIGQGMMSSANTSTLDKYLGDFWRNAGCLFFFKDQMNLQSVIVCVIAVCVAISSLVYLVHLKTQKEAALFLLALSLVPLVRFFLLSNHSFLHYFFTYRALWISVSCTLYYIWITCFEGRKSWKRKR